MKVFLQVWLGQLISAIGSRLTNFAIGVWVYQQTGSVTQFALIFLFTYVPETLLSPLAGAYVDRWDRRWAMILSDAGAGVGTLLIALLLFTGNLNSVYLYLLLAIRASFTAFHLPAYASAITLLFDEKHFGRISGMVQLTQATSQIVAPMLAGLLVVHIHVEGVLFIDVCSFFIALTTLVDVRFPAPKATALGQIGKGSILLEMASGWNYIVTFPGLLGLLLFSLIPFFSLGMLEALFTPLVLSFASTSDLGIVLTIGGGGWFLGGLCISLWGGPRRRVYGIFGFVTLQGFCLLLSSWQPSLSLAATGCFGYLFAYPVILSCNQAIWQSKVLPDLQGRVFGVKRFVDQFPSAVAYVVAGPLVDRVFNPWFATDGMLTYSIGRVIGVGDGRGISFLFILLGILNILAAIAACQYSPLRLIDNQLHFHPSNKITTRLE